MIGYKNGVGVKWQIGMLGVMLSLVQGCLGADDLVFVKGVVEYPEVSSRLVGEGVRAALKSLNPWVDAAFAADVLLRDPGYSRGFDQIMPPATFDGNGHIFFSATNCAVVYEKLRELLKTKEEARKTYENYKKAGFVPPEIEAVYQTETKAVKERTDFLDSYGCPREESKFCDQWDRRMFLPFGIVVCPERAELDRAELDRIED